ncbi:MAG: class I SAM-dependent methyltransferase [Magnetococcus sp. YQC-5]
MYCHLCHSLRMDLFTQEERDSRCYTVLRCLECGVIQTQERHALISPDYIQLDESEVDPARIWCQSQHKAPAFAQWERLMTETCKEGPDTLLDVGCGTGGFLRHATRLGWKPFGFDSSKAQVDYARRQTATVRQAISASDYLAQLENAPLLFQVITLWDVLEHIRQPDIFIKDLRRILSPEGLLFISVPNGGALPWKKRVYRLLGRPFSVDPWEHVFYYTPSALTRYLREWGFEILRQGSVACYPRSHGLFEMLRRIGFWLLAPWPGVSPQIFILARKSKENVMQSNQPEGDAAP